MRLKCPTCSALLNIPDIMMGKLVSCPKCQVKFVANSSMLSTDTATAPKPAAKKVVADEGYQLDSTTAGPESTGPEYTHWKNCPNCGVVWTSGSEVCFKCHFNARLNRVIKPVKDSRFALRLDAQKMYVWIAIAGIGVGIYFLAINWGRIRVWANSLWPH